jgi:hypothetical protein
MLRRRVAMPQGRINNKSDFNGSIRPLHMHAATR